MIGEMVEKVRRNGSRRMRRVGREGEEKWVEKDVERWSRRWWSR